MSARTEAALERSRRSSREAKRRRTGTCEDCGAVTRYNGTNGQNGPSRYCRRCADIRGHEKLRGRGSLQARLYALLREYGELRFIAIRDALGLSSGHAGYLLSREAANGRVTRVRRGVYRL